MDRTSATEFLTEQIREQIRVTLLEWRNDWESLESFGIGANYRNYHGKKQTWRLIKRVNILKEYNHYKSFGSVHEEVVDSFFWIILENYCKLMVNGHIYYGKHDMDFYELYKDKIQQALPSDSYWRFQDYFREHSFSLWITDENGVQRFSDYGLQPILELIFKYFDCEDYGQKFFIIDQILSCTHARNDLASWFVETGKQVLDEIFQK